LEADVGLLFVAEDDLFAPPPAPASFPASLPPAPSISSAASALEVVLALEGDVGLLFVAEDDLFPPPPAPASSPAVADVLVAPPADSEVLAFLNIESDQDKRTLKSL
jgi:hypothetical protein